MVFFFNLNMELLSYEYMKISLFSLITAEDSTLVRVRVFCSCVTSHYKLGGLKKCMCHSQSLRVELYTEFTLGSHHGVSSGGSTREGVASAHVVLIRIQLLTGGLTEGHSHFLPRGPLHGQLTWDSWLLTASTGRSLLARPGLRAHVHNVNTHTPSPSLCSWCRKQVTGPDHSRGARAPQHAGCLGFTPNLEKPLPH